MLVAGFPAGAFQANCYLLAPGPDRACVIVDPGEDAGAPLGRVVAEHGLTPAAILATHGHPDHVHAAADTARAYDVPVLIRSEDRRLLSRPWLGLNDELAAGLGDRPWPEPHTVRELGADGEPEPVLELAGLRIEALHTPGHTAGSTVFRLATGEGGQVALTGDTLLPGSAGRTDLPGGDRAALRRSLARLTATLPDDTVLLPGHGPSTTMGQEKTSNPWLAAEGRGTAELRHTDQGHPGEAQADDGDADDGDAGRGDTEECGGADRSGPARPPRGPAAAGERRS